MSAIYRLQCKTQSYDWGKLGNVSKVAAYAKASGTTVDDKTPYAELWMGTHPNAPSIVMDGKDTPLNDLIRDNEKLSTKAVYDQYNGDLPFLFKILSIRKALSIQAHPDKVLGSRLFKEFPDNYKDPNHKPEMALALTPFEALCGFRPLNEIAQHMETYPELKEVLGNNVSDEFLATVKATGNSESEKDVAHNREILKKTFGALMRSSQKNVTHILSKLVARLNDIKANDPISKLVIRLDEQYPGGDIGVFSCLMLNYVIMEPGQAIFLGANEPHAYLSGDCVECMAASDNVVRAGLTPKFKDVEVLVDMLTYRYGTAESQKMTPEKFADHSLLYDPPIDEFSVVWTKMEAAQTEKHKQIEGPSVLIVTSGSGNMTSEALKTESDYKLEEGYVYFVGANTPLVAQAGNSGLEFYRAFCIATSN
ncbi:phosphomannose isomerase type I [Parasitella parasitica]|nr:phosphomannose isomerase type I [Parasitella parasitica]